MSVLFAIIIIILFAPFYFLIKSSGKYSKQNKELQYFGIKDSGYSVSVWPKDKGIGECMEFNIAGVSYRKGIDKYLGEFEGRLIEEPHNPYDANAIKIVAADGHHVGYVPKDMTNEVRQLKKLPCKCFCFIGKRYENNRSYYFTDCYIDI